MTSPNLPGIELEDELGRGAHSIVYRGRRGNDRFAVKVPRTKGRWTRWVYREAVALARVHHPGLPAIVEVGEADGLPYLVMELVQGETLGDRLTRGKLPPSEVLALALRLAEALSEVHDAGLVHRDVKPRNIIVEAGAEARLVDFGFAAPLERLTYGEGGAGTLGYGAPEQFRVPSRVDGRADLFALGRVMFECLTGRLERRPTPSGATPISIVADLIASASSAPLAEVVRGLLREDPDQRYPDARALIHDLRRVEASSEPLGPEGYVAKRRLAPLVGRAEELGRILRRWSRTSSDRGSVVVVQASRGGGKTRLLSECVAKVVEQERGHALRSDCREDDPPLTGLRRLLDQLVARVERSSEPSRAAAHAAIRTAAGEDLGFFATMMSPKLEPILGEQAPPPADTTEAFPEGAAEFFVRLARQLGPLFLVVDDFQWTDAVSRDVLLRLAHRVHEQPIALVVGTRGARAVVRSLAELSPSHLEWLDLAPLADDEIASLVATYLGELAADAVITRRVAALGDGTPLGVLEAVGALVDVGALRPQVGAWQLDPSRADAIALPTGTMALFAWRLRELPPATLRVLESASILGAAFEDELLATLIGISDEDLGYGLAEGRRAGFLEVEERGRHRFVHDAVRENLLETMEAVSKRRSHQRAAEIIDSRGENTLEALCAKALHYAAGETEKTPHLTFRAARAAAEAAVRSFDNETALRFFELARAAMDRAGERADQDFHASLGEAQLRLGATNESVVSFERALAAANVDDRRARARLLGRISWVHQTSSEPDRAWGALERAFETMDSKMPIESPASAVRVLAHFARATAENRAAWLSTERDAGDVALLRDLHLQNVRLGVEYGKPFRIVLSALEARALSLPADRSSVQARSLAWYGFVLSLLGQRKQGAARFEEAKQMSQDISDPVSHGFVVQLRAMTEGWGGSFDLSLELMRECVDVHGHWLELNEYCLDAASCDFMEALRGRSSESWWWIARVVERIRRSPWVSQGFAEYVVHRAAAALAGTGAKLEEEPWIASQLEAIESRGAAGGFYRTLSWGARARLLLERGELGREFEELVREFEAERHNPRSSHIALVEFYIAVAHARVHQCLRARGPERSRIVPELRKVHTELQRAAKIPLLKAHAAVIEGYVSWFSRSGRAANRAFSRAEALGHQETCPWVLYAVARARAHVLRDEGNLVAALAQARLAEKLATDQGAQPRAEWIREEFDLPSPPRARSSGSSGSAASSRSRESTSVTL